MPQLNSKETYNSEGTGTTGGFDEQLHHDPMDTDPMMMTEPMMTYPMNITDTDQRMNTDATTLPADPNPHSMPALPPKKTVPSNNTNNNHQVAAATAAAAATTVTMESHLTLTGYFMIASFVVVFTFCVLTLAWLALRRRRQLIAAGIRTSGYFHPAGGRGGTITKQRIQRRYETVEHWIISKQVQPHDDFCAAVRSNFDHHNHHHNHHEQQQTSEDEETLTETAADAAVTSSTSGAIGCSAECLSLSPAVVKETNETGAAHKAPQPQPQPSSSTPSDLGTTDNDAGEWSSSEGDNSSSSSLSLQYCDDDEDGDGHECPICLTELLQGQIVSWSANEQCSHGTCVCVCSQ